MTYYGIYDNRTHELLAGGFEARVYAWAFADKQGFERENVYVWEEAKS